MVTGTISTSVIKAILDVELRGASQVRQAQRIIDSVDKQLKKTQNNMNNAMLGFGLSALFTGMAIKNLGQNIMNSLVKTYMTATDEQSRFNQKLLGVQAAFEFLKFSIMDALGNSDLIVAFIDGVVILTNKISLFISKNPGIALIVAGLSAAAVAAGTLGMIIGQVVLAFVGIAGLFTGAGSFAAIAPILAIIAATLVLIGLGAYFTYTYLKKHPEHIEAIKSAWSAAVSPLIEVFAKIKDIYSYLKDKFPTASNYAFAVMIAGAKTLFETLTMPVQLLYQLLSTLDSIKEGDFSGAFKSIKRAVAVSSPVINFGDNFQSVLDSMNQATEAAALRAKQAEILALGGALNPITGIHSNSSNAFIKAGQEGTYASPISTNTGLSGVVSDFTSEFRNMIDQFKSGMFGSNLNITINGDVADDQQLSKLRKEMEFMIEDMRNRTTGITQGA